MWPGVVAKSQIARQTAGAWSTTTDTGASQALGCSITAAASARSVHNRHPPYQTPNSAQQPLRMSISRWSRWSPYEPDLLHWRSHLRTV